MTRILVVEDDGALRNDISDRLAGWGHEVKTAADGHHGFEAISEWQPDLVLSDINMPNENGFELVDRIKKLGPDYADMAFIFVTSLSGSKQIVSGIESGADDYITKPIDYDLLRAKINSHLRKTENLASKFALDQFANSMAGNMMNGVMLVSVIGGLGFFVVLALYWIKSALGINIFQDVHFGDLFH